MAKDGYWNSTLQRQVVQAIKDAQKFIDNPPKATASNANNSSAANTTTQGSNNTNTTTNTSNAASTQAALVDALDKVLQQRFGLGNNNVQGNNGLFSQVGQPLWGSPNMPGWGLAPVFLPLSVPLSPTALPPGQGQPWAGNAASGLAASPSLASFFSSINNMAPAPSPLQQWYQALLSAPVPANTLLPQASASLTASNSNFLNGPQPLLSSGLASKSILSSANTTATPAESSLEQLLTELKTMLEGMKTNVNKPAPVASSYEEQLMQLMMERLSNVGPQGKALELLNLSLKTSEGENDSDEDSFAVSQADIETLKTALKNKDVTLPQMTAAFQWLFNTAPHDALDELSVLFGKLVDQNVLQASPLLSSAYLGQMDEVRRAALASGLANAGVIAEDKSINKDLAGWTLQQLSSSDETTANFAKELQTATAKAWTPYKDTEEGKRVFAFLQDWAGWQPEALEATPSEAAAV